MQSSRGRMVCAVVVLATGLASADGAEERYIDGGPDNVAFGSRVLALPNGNFVVTDPDARANGVLGAGSIYLYRFDGTLISVLSGSTSGDHVGNGALLPLPGGDVVVHSPDWLHGAGAVTLLRADTGASGVVSASNSLVGSRQTDKVGQFTAIVLANGNFVVNTQTWAAGTLTNAGAATFVDVSIGTAGVIGPGNSLVGDRQNQLVGSVVPLGGGNYVVCNANWKDATDTIRGACAWGSGTAGVRGVLSEANAVVGNAADGVRIAHATALTNGHYVLGFSCSTGACPDFRRGVLWVDGSAARLGTIDPAQALLDTGLEPVVALSNGNYVVRSPNWGGGQGAITWGNGTGGTAGVVGPSNSLTGAASAATDKVVALSNGHYVVTSRSWDNGSTVDVGAFTWADGTAPLVGPVSTANSVHGTAANDFYDLAITPLTNGNYVATTSEWSGGRGAARWATGLAATAGPLMAADALTGASPGDQVGRGGVTALSNGHYVVLSPDLKSGGTFVGAATWGDGVTGTVGPVDVSNSLVGAPGLSRLVAATPLRHGRWVARSSDLNLPGTLTWRRGFAPEPGGVSAANSLVGQQPGDLYFTAPRSLEDGGAIIQADSWDYGARINTGAMFIARANGLTGVPGPGNGYVDTDTLAGIRADYSVSTDALVVGMPTQNRVLILRTDSLFGDKFE